MHKHQVSQLSYDEAIKQFGAAVTSFSVGQFVLLDGATTSFLAESIGPVTPRNSLVVAEVVKVSEDGQTAKVSKFHRIYESGGNRPESDYEDLRLDYVSKSVEERIKNGDDLFGIM